MGSFMDSFDKVLVRLHVISPLLQFDRYLHRYNLPHEHLDSETIIRTGGSR